MGKSVLGERWFVKIINKNFLWEISLGNQELRNSGTLKQPRKNKNKNGEPSLIILFQLSQFNGNRLDNFTHGLCSPCHR